MQNREERRQESIKRLKAANDKIFAEIDTKNELMMAQLLKKNSWLFVEYRQCLWDYKYAITNFQDLVPMVPNTILAGLEKLSMDDLKSPARDTAVKKQEKGKREAAPKRRDDDLYSFSEYRKKRR